MNTHKAHNSLTFSASINSQEPTPHFNVTALKASFFPPFFLLHAIFLSLIHLLLAIHPHLGGLPSSLASHLRLKISRGAKCLHTSQVLCQTLPLRAAKNHRSKSAKQIPSQTGLINMPGRKPRLHEDIAHLMRLSSSAPFHAPISPNVHYPYLTLSVGTLHHF